MARELEGLYPDEASRVLSSAAIRYLEERTGLELQGGANQLLIYRQTRQLRGAAFVRECLDLIDLVGDSPSQPG